MAGNCYPKGAKQIAWLSAIFIFLCVYIALATKANLDLSDGRFALFMDERITFDGVRKILHPGEWKSFWWSVTDGGDQRYGRSLWNSIAIFSYLPERVWGVTGQIVAARMTQVCFLTIAFLVLAFGLVKSWPLRTTLLIALLSMPYADYYMTMPKPEPLQLFFLAVFLYFYNKQKLTFGRYWIFLGLAFGTKISTLPASIVFVVASMLTYKKNDQGADLLKRLKEALLFFAIGLGIAVPVLLKPVLLSASGYFLFSWLCGRYKLKSFVPFLLTALGVILAAIVSQKELKYWIEWTFLSTAHASDQSSINALSWLSYMFDSWLVVPEWLGIILAVFFFGFVCIYSVRRITGGRNKPLSSDIGLVVLMCGLFLNLAIFFSAHRLWGFYLFPGTALMLVGLFSLLDAGIEGMDSRGAGHGTSLERYSAYCTVGLVLGVSGYFWIPERVQAFDTLAVRTGSDEYKKQYSSYTETVNYLDNQPRAGSRKLMVAFDMSSFIPPDNERYKIVEFLGSYSYWQYAPDVIVFGPTHTAKGEVPPADSLRFKTYLSEREGYAKYVINKNEECSQKKCFEREMVLPNGGEILKLRESVL